MLEFTHRFSRQDLQQPLESLRTALIRHDVNPLTGVYILVNGFETLVVSCDDLSSPYEDLRVELTNIDGGEILVAACADGEVEATVADVATLARLAPEAANDDAVGVILEALGAVATLVDQFHLA